jgi:hypothetical protein
VALLQPQVPADAIWRAVLMNDDDAMAAIDLKDKPAWLLIARGPGGIDVTRLADAEGRLLAALCAGRTVAEAIANGEGVDATLALATWFARGLFIDYSLSPEQVP